jgi:hypothetical protein
LHQAVNNTACDLKLALYDASGTIFSYSVPAGGTITLGVSGTDSFPDMIGVVNVNEKQYPFSGLPVPGCTPCIEMQGKPSNCCATVCYNQATCTFTIDPCGPPC